MKVWTERASAADGYRAEGASAVEGVGQKEPQLLKVWTERASAVEGVDRKSLSC